MDYSEPSTGTIFLKIVVFIVVLAAQWRVFSKAGVPGWVCLIPIYDLYKLFEIAGMNGWMFLLMIIPIVNIFIAITLIVNLARVFEKGLGFALGLIFLYPIFICILGFGSAEYIGN